MSGESELETERMRVTACEVAALANTKKSAAGRIGRSSPYWTPSYGAVCDAVDREMALREAAEGAIGALEKINELVKDALRNEWDSR